MLQGVATSIDALSVGFTMTELNAVQALAESALIGAVTFCICTAGILTGRKVGTKLSGKAAILGGIVLIAIGIKIAVSGS
jgi:putative Mn2+ efflux pump MntP